MFAGKALATPVENLMGLHFIRRLQGLPANRTNSLL